MARSFLLGRNLNLNRVGLVLALPGNAKMSTRTTMNGKPVLL